MRTRLGSAATIGFGVLVLCNALLLGNAWFGYLAAHPGALAGNWPTFSRALASAGGTLNNALAAVAGAGLFAGALAGAVMHWERARDAVAGRVVLWILVLLFVFAALLGVAHYFHVSITLAVDTRRHMLLSYLFFFGMSAVIIGDLFCHLRLARVLPAGAGVSCAPSRRATGFGVLGAGAVFLLTFVLKDLASNPWARETQRVFVMSETAWIVLAHAYALLYIPVLRAYFARPRLADGVRPAAREGGGLMLRACLGFAWAGLARGDRFRFAVATSGATVAIFVMLLHVALLRAVEHKAAQVYGLFNAEVVLVSERFQFLYRMSDFPVARLRQAQAHPGVRKSAAVRVDNTAWVRQDTGAQISLMLIGIDPDPEFVADAEIRAAMAELQAPRRVLLDRRSDSAAGPLDIGASGNIGSRAATIAGHYELGLPMYALATAVVSNADFSLYTGEDPRRAQLGLLRLAPGADAARVARELSAVLPDDVRVLTRERLMAREAAFFVDVKPLGIMMRAGLLIAMVVGAVALFQAMSAQVESRMRDFAVLRAMGFDRRFTHAAGALQLLLMGGTGFTLAWLAAIPVFDSVERKSQLFLPPDAWLLGATLALCVPMAAAAAVPLLRAGRADPAGLF